MYSVYNTEREELINRDSYNNMMGSVLSSREQKAIEPHLQGFDPSSLATVIWDAINQVGVDDEKINLGIYFEDTDPTEEPENGASKVTFWDGGEAQQMPRKVFLEIMLLVGETTISNYEDNYDLERSGDLGISVRRLKLAVANLKKEIEKLQEDPSAGAYRQRLDSGVSMESDNIVDELRARRGSWMWTTGEGDTNTFNPNRRRSTKGMDGVLDRLPELRRRFSLSNVAPRQSTALSRVKNKLKVLALLQKGSVISPEAIHEEHEEEEEEDMRNLITPPPGLVRHTSLPMYNLLTPEIIPTTPNEPLFPTGMSPTDDLELSSEASTYTYDTLREDVLSTPTTCTSTCTTPEED